MLTPEQLDEVLAPFFAPGADPVVPDFETCDHGCLLRFLFDTVLSYEMAAIATEAGDERGRALAARTLRATSAGMEELRVLVRAMWLEMEAEAITRGH